MIQEKEIIKRSQQQLLQLAEQLNDIEIIQFQDKVLHLSLIHISEPTRLELESRLTG